MCARFGEWMDAARRAFEKRSKEGLAVSEINLFVVVYVYMCVCVSVCVCV